MDKRHPSTKALSASLGFAVCLGAVSAAAQETSNVQTAETDSSSWTAPRTPWGDPDLQGKWPLDSAGQTPFQRPPELGERAWLTDEEYAAALEQAAQLADNYQEELEANRIGSGHWFEWGKPLRQTSLIMEPANGRIPPMTEAGRAEAANMKSSWSEDVFDEISDFNALDRCITRGMPASMIPFPYNNGVEIIQTPGYVVIRLELIHETRIVPLDDRAPPAEIRQWLGISRGRWDGDSLVIETTNFNGLSPMVIVGPSNEPVPTSPSLRVTERLTPTGPNTLQYEAWVEDPEVLTAPFKISYPWTRNEDYKFFEYACHEGNTVVRNYIETTNPRFVGEENAGVNFDVQEWLRLSVDRFQESEEETPPEE
ncbi:MAG TPA: hypothetical protein VF329_11055 [Gammaproteobacteria bacterium]